MSSKDMGLPNWFGITELPKNPVPGSDGEAYLLGLHTRNLCEDMNSFFAEQLRSLYKEYENLQRLMDTVYKLKIHFKDNP